jgi:hypothetical protein
MPWVYWKGLFCRRIKAVGFDKMELETPSGSRFIIPLKQIEPFYFDWEYTK